MANYALLFILFIALCIIMIHFRAQWSTRTIVYGGSAIADNNNNYNITPMTLFEALLPNEKEALKKYTMFPFYIEYTNIPEVSYRAGVPQNYLNIEKKRNDTFININTHLGQRKLLLNEIEFLTEYGDLSGTVVYAGAATGEHIPFLVDLFPKHTFNLYDPREFCRELQGKERVKLNVQYFTDADAKKFASLRPLFICDIRTAENISISPELFDEEIIENMSMQMRWTTLINASMASLKFRLPWIKHTNKYPYFDGKLVTQPWQPVHSTESRLYTEGKSMTTYDSKKYENQGYYHNILTRPFRIYEEYKAAWETNPETSGVDLTLCSMDFCYDCVREIEIWRSYVKKNRNTSESLGMQIKKMIDQTDIRLRKSLAQTHKKRIICKLN